MHFMLKCADPERNMVNVDFYSEKLKKGEQKMI